jgi:hypothetical protein
MNEPPREQLAHLASDLKQRVSLPNSRASTWKELMPVFRDLVEAYTKRKRDGLLLYRPINKTIQKFHKSRARIRLVSGGNQSGKTSSALACIVRIWRGMDPYKKRPDKNLRILQCSLDLDHIGQVIWHKIWWPGLFQILPDEETGLWRAVRPDPENPTEIDPIDLEREDLWMPSPPLLPALRSRGWRGRRRGRTYRAGWS